MEHHVTFLYIEFLLEYPNIDCEFAVQKKLWPNPDQLISMPMVYRPLYQWYIDPPTLNNYWLLLRSTHDQVHIVMSRLKLKVNNGLLNNKEFFKLFNSIFNKIGYNCFIIFQDYLNIKILKYDENFEFWNFIYFF